MDDFVRDKLTEWGLCKWIEKFKEEEVDTESFYCLDDQQIAKLIPKLGPQAKFKKKLLKEQNTANPDKSDASAQVIAPSIGTSNKRKRKSDLQGESFQQHSRTKKQCLAKGPRSYSEQGFAKESFYCLDDQQIAKLIPKVEPPAKFKKKLLKEQNTANPDKSDASAQVIPYTSGTSNEGKRKSDLQGESNQQQSPTKKQRLAKGLRSYSEEIIQADVKKIMRCVLQKIPPEKNQLNDFLRKKISDLKTEKREVVGVFGKTGAGKSYLINAVIGLKKFLPSGGVRACTSVLIKVEANMQNSKYEAIIEFITKEEWRDELWFSKNFRQDNEEDDTEYRDIDEKLSALYGEDWKEKSPDDLMDAKYFRKIPEFLLSKEKILTADEDEELSENVIRYTRTKPDDAEDKSTRRWYWPLVKCVTIKVPNADLLKHVTLVDLPGSGDRNKSRDKMWKTVVGSCSTIWIVADIKRVASEVEAWDILKDACSNMGNGGQCNQIHFICTQSDLHPDAKDTSKDGIRDFILKRNQQAKKEVMKEFHQLKGVKKHFSEESFKVFTVSSIEFLNQKYLNKEQTEIPKLKQFLKELNDCHKETLNYVSGARGILSLIQGASRRGGAEIKKAVCTILERKMKGELVEVWKQMEETYLAFEKCLSDGVEKSERSCEKVLESVINPKKRSGSSFHMTLKYLVQHNGIYNAKTNKNQNQRKQKNLNMELSSYLTESIEEKFKETFPNEVNCEPFNGKLNSFSLDTKRMKMNPKYKDVELQLEFLNAEEDKKKNKLIKIIRDRKKKIYSSLMTTVEESMQKCYDDAKVISGTNSLRNMRETMKKHVHDSKNMFKNAKDIMLNQLEDLMTDIMKDLKETMQESIELSLKTYGDSIPDVTVELDMVKNHYKGLREPQKTSSLFQSAKLMKS
ncbi:nuclear GTPase SLIP-GC isoform X1 [Gasterosteus aculeatus]